MLNLHAGLLLYSVKAGLKKAIEPNSGLPSPHKNLVQNPEQKKRRCPLYARDVIRS